MSNLPEEQKIVKVVVFALITGEKIIAKIDVNQFVGNNTTYSGKLRETHYLLENPAVLMHTYDSTTRQHFFDLREYAPDSTIGTVPVRKEHVTSFRYAREEVASMYLSHIGLSLEEVDELTDKAIKDYLDALEFDDEDIQ